MDNVWRLDRFDLDDDAFLDQEIGDKFPNQNVFITYFDPMLLGDLKVDLPKFNDQCIFINLFKESGTQDVAHPVHTTDDFLRDLIKP